MKIILAVITATFARSERKAIVRIVSNHSVSKYGDPMPGIHCVANSEITQTLESC